LPVSCEDSKALEEELLEAFTLVVKCKFGKELLSFNFGVGGVDGLCESGIEAALACVASIG
jgi:hypothetical protein